MMPTMKHSEGKLSSVSKTGKSDTASFVELVVSSLSEMDWGVEEFGKVYGNVVKNKPYTKERIYQMIREDSFPQDPKRRYVIAKLLQISPALLGVSTLEHLLSGLPLIQQETKIPSFRKRKGMLDREEFQTALQTIETQYASGMGYEALAMIAARLQALHNEVLYQTDEGARSIKRLVCEYQMAAGNILRDQFRVAEAEKHLDKAVLVAKNNALHEQYVAALLRRGVLFLDKGKIATASDVTMAQQYFSLALRDFLEGRTYLSHLQDTQLTGDIVLLIGATRAHQAQDKKDFSISLREVDQAAKMIEQGSTQDKGIYYIDRASLFIASPQKELHDSHNAFESLEEAAKYIGPDRPRRYAYLHITEAQLHIEKRWYPTATELAKEAIMLTKPLRSGVNNARLVNMCERLKESSYGKHIEVAELIGNVMKLQYPQLFPEV